MIDVSLYLEIFDLFRFRYDPPVLGIVAERPHRFRELVSQLEIHVAGHVDDNAVDRSLKRLARVKHVVKAETNVGNRSVSIYTITAAGCRSLRVYAGFVDAYRTMNAQDGRAGPGGGVA